MLGNGVKRKLDQDEDGLEGDRVLLGCGGLGGGPSRASYTLQRQTVLNMSLMKLYGPRTGADLGLQRRVLINNVIRRIHDDFRQEGGLRTILLSVTTATPGAGPGEVQLSPPPPGPSLSVLSAGLSGLDSCLTPASLLEEDPPLFSALPGSVPPPLHPSLRPPPSPPSSDSFSTALEEIEELCSSSSLPASSPPSSPSSPPPAAPALFTDVTLREEVQGLPKEEREEKARPAGKPPPAPPPPLHGTTDTLACTPPPAGGFLTDFALDDVLFTDIDTSMYDFSPCTPGPSKMADDLVRTISGYGGTAVGSSQSQPFRMDLAELDHIMEVLVGS